MTDENPRAVIGDNNPPPYDPDMLADHAKRMQELVDGANRCANDIGTIERDDQAARISAFVDQLRAHRGAVESTRKNEKAVHDAAGKAVQTAYLPLLDRLDAALKVVNGVLRPWLSRKEAEAAAERERARRAADEARLAAEAVARAAETETGGDVVGRAVAAKEAEQKAEEAAREARRADKMKVGVAPSVGAGRAKSIRRHDVVRITNRALIPRSVLLLVDEEAILKALRANMDVARNCPGVEVKTEETVV